MEEKNFGGIKMWDKKSVINLLDALKADVLNEILDKELIEDISSTFEAYKQIVKTRIKNKNYIY
uniref:Uncharacterized protein n=1 Tax=viral metagenome TaxID=1070528 RepID=A0A6M3IIV1_9ZZZZ